MKFMKIQQIVRSVYIILILLNFLILYWSSYKWMQLLGINFILSLWIYSEITYNRFINKWGNL